MTGNKREFVDTSVLVHAYNASEPVKQTIARALLTELWNAGNGCVSIQVLQEFYDMVTTKIPLPIPAETAAMIVGDLGHWNHHIPEVPDLLEAARIREKYDLAFLDAMILCSARKLQCHLLWSENIGHDIMMEGITVRNPFHRYTEGPAYLHETSVQYLTTSE